MSWAGESGRRSSWTSVTPTATRRACPGLRRSSSRSARTSSALSGFSGLPRRFSTRCTNSRPSVVTIETVAAYVGAAATKSVGIGLIILVTACFFTQVEILHPFWMVAFLLLTSITFSLFGFIIGIWAKSFEQLAIIPSLVITPLTFLGGAFYSIDMLPQPWRTLSLFNPVVYLVSGFRWSFYGIGDVSVGVSLGVTAAFMAACMLLLAFIFRTGWRLKP